MSGNNDPIYTKVGDVQSIGPINTVASVLYDGSGTIGTDVYKIFTADATNGGYVQRIRFKYVANATTTSVAAVVKIYISTKTSGSTTNADTILIDEIALPATGALTTTAANSGYDCTINMALPPGYTLLAKITVAQSASTGWMATAIGGKY